MWPEDGIFHKTIHSARAAKRMSKEHATTQVPRQAGGQTHQAPQHPAPPSSSLIDASAALQQQQASLHVFVPHIRNLKRGN